MHNALKETALHDYHVKLGAKMVEFGGYEMPVSYPQGTLKEHLACRNNAVIFDVSHLGTVELSGNGAFDKIQNLLTNNLAKIGVSQTQYTHLLDDNGFVTDDIIVWWISDETFFVMPNATNTDSVVSVLGGNDITESRSILAVQGPRAKEHLAKIEPKLLDVKSNHTYKMSIAGVECQISGTGYTGEDGLEIHVENEFASDIFEMIINLETILPAGLGARDTLRLEAGLPLYGHELSSSTTPYDARLGWVVDLNKPHFRGREALLELKNNKSRRKLFGLASSTKRPLRDNLNVLSDGSLVGTTTSGNFSPVLNVGIAMAYLDDGDYNDLDVEIRGQIEKVKITKLPFVKHNRTKNTKNERQ